MFFSCFRCCKVYQSGQRTIKYAMYIYVSLALFRHAFSLSGCNRNVPRHCGACESARDTCLVYTPRSLELDCAPPPKKHLNLDVVLESTRHLRDITRHLTIYVCRRPTFVVLLRDITRHSGALTPVRPTRHLRDTRSSFLFSPRGLYFQLWPPRATHRRSRLST